MKCERKWILMWIWAIFDENLVKISPLLKTLITPQEVFDKFVPNIFSCFESYHKIHKFLAKHGHYFAPKNNKKISVFFDAPH